MKPPPSVPPAAVNFNDPIDYDQPFPSEEEIAQIDNLVEPLVALLSPVFLSKEKGSNRLVRGLGPVPTGLQGRPVLLVGNHQLLGKWVGCLDEMEILHWMLKSVEWSIEI